MQPASPLAAGFELTRSNIIRAAFSFPTVLGALLVVLTVLTVHGRFSDPDVWWHLKTGEIIWTTHQIPTTDTFSYTTNNQPYVPHEWMSQITIYGAYRFGGFAGLMLWKCAFSSLLVIAAYLLCTMYSASVKVAFLGGLITWLFATISFSMRPQMIGYLLLECTLILIYLGRTHDARWFFVFPPLFAIWVNCHGSFFLGLIVLGAALVCSYVDVEWGLLRSDRWNRRSRKILAIVFVLSLAAIFINPVGWRQITYPLATLTKMHLSMIQVSEWAPPQFNEIRGAAMLLIAGLILLIPLLRRIPLRFEEILSLALGFGLAIQHSRMLIVFGMLAAPTVCRLLADCWDRYQPEEDRPVANAVLLAISVAVMVWVFPSRQEIAQDIQENNPVKAVDFIQQAGLTGNMLNDYTWGGYLIWAAPQHKVFVDGRGDVFEFTGVLGDYFRWTSLQDDPNMLLNKYHIDFCLLSAESPMSRVLTLLPGWSKVYSDETSIVWARSSAKS